MSEKIYLHLLFFCGILCQGIFATLSDKDTKLSSNFLVRNRRVINHLPDGRHPQRIEDVNYIVKIKQSNRAVCAGTILSLRTVITAALCFYENSHLLPKDYYQVYSGSAGNTGYNLHNVSSKIVNNGNTPNHPLESIALITVDPPFIYTQRTGNIRLNTGPIPTYALASVFGWGYLYPPQPGTELRQRLRTIILPVMNHEECRTIYHGRINITERHICTYHPQQYCAYNDEGAPLVVNDRLVGIHIWKGDCSYQRNPDVFINLQRPEYSEWIREHTR